MDRVENGCEGIAQLVREHRQKLVLAAAEIGKGFGLLLCFLLQQDSYGDVANIALGDLNMSNRLDIAHNLNVNHFAPLGLEGQVLITDILLLT